MLNHTTYRSDLEAYLERIDKIEWSAKLRANLPDAQRINLTEDEQHIINTFENFIIRIADTYEEDARKIQDKQDKQTVQSVKQAEQEQAKHIEILQKFNEQYKEALHDIFSKSRQALHPDMKF